MPAVSESSCIEFYSADCVTSYELVALVEGAGTGVVLAPSDTTVVGKALRVSWSPPGVSGDPDFEVFGMIEVEVKYVSCNGCSPTVNEHGTITIRAFDRDSACVLKMAVVASSGESLTDMFCEVGIRAVVESPDRLSATAFGVYNGSCDCLVVVV